MRLTQPDWIQKQSSLKNMHLEEFCNSTMGKRKNMGITAIYCDEIKIDSPRKRLIGKLDPSEETRFKESESELNKRKNSHLLEKFKKKNFI